MKMNVRNDEKKQWSQNFDQQDETCIDRNVFISDKKFSRRDCKFCPNEHYNDSNLIYRRFPFVSTLSFVVPIFCNCDMYIMYLPKVLTVFHLEKSFRYGKLVRCVHVSFESLKN